MPASLIKRAETEARRQEVWALYCQGVVQHEIARRLGVVRRTVEADLAKVRRSHHTREMGEGDRFAEAYETMRQASQLLRGELAEIKACGGDTVRVLGLVSCHADRMARFLTRQSAVAQVDVNVGGGELNMAAVQHLLGRAPAQQLQSAAVDVQVMPQG